MKPLFVLVVLPILLFGALRAGFAAPRQKPPAAKAVLVPRQTYRMEAQDKLDTRNQSISEQETRNWNIAVTPREIIVVSHGHGDQSVALVAFDRDTGRQLWRKARPANSEANELFGNDASGAEIMPRNAQTKQTNVYLQLLGTASRQDGRSVVVLVFAFYDDTQPGKRTTLEYALHCIEADSGREIWRFNLENRAPIGVYGSVIALMNDGHANFLDALTGQPVLLSTPEGKAAIKQAGEQYGTSLAMSFPYPDQPRLLHLDTGMAQNLQTLRGYANLVGMTANRGVILVNMDDDYAGHSVWPHYVYSVDEMGKSVWRFPTFSLLPGADFDMATGKVFNSAQGQSGRDFEDVLQAQVVAASKMAIVVSGTPYQAQQRKITGLRATDGRVLWRNPSGAIRFLRAYERGCFALMESGQLLYIDAQTGQKQSCGKLPACENFLVAGKDLFTVHSDGAIAAYDMPHLNPPVPVPAPRAHSILTRVPTASKPAATNPKPISRNILWNFYQAIEKDDIAGVRKGLQQGIPLNKLLPDYDRTPLMLAASSRAPKTFHSLLDHHANIYIRAPDGTTALHYAAIGGSYSIMRTLLAAGLSMNVRNRVGDTPLMLLTRYNMLEPDRMRFLVRHGADINTLNSENQSALHLAVDNDLMPMTRLLLSIGADPDVRNKWGGTPLMLAANVTNPDVALLQLLLAKGASVNARDNGGRTPLIHLLWDASSHYIHSYRDNEGEQKPPSFTPPREDCLRLLLRKGTNINAQDKQNTTALDWAKLILAKCETDEHRKQAQHVIDILLAAGAKR